MISPSLSRIRDAIRMAPLPETYDLTNHEGAVEGPSAYDRRFIYSQQLLAPLLDVVEAVDASLAQNNQEGAYVDRNTSPARAALKALEGAILRTEALIAQVSQPAKTSGESPDRRLESPDRGGFAKGSAQ